jgi:TIR domain-containing protein
MAHDVFISYSSEDKLAADALCGALEAARIRCWMAPRDVVPALSYSGQITRAIKASRVMVLIFSEHSNGSAAVLAEVELAANAGVHILNFRVDASPLSDDLRFYLQHRHWLDALTPPMERYHARLVPTIQGLLAPASTSEEAELATPTLAPPTVVPGKTGPSKATKFPLLGILLSVALVAGGTIAIWRWSAGHSSAPTPIRSTDAKSSPLATPESSPRIQRGDKAKRTANVQPPSSEDPKPGTSTPVPVEPSAAMSATSFSTDRDHPTPLHSGEVRGTGRARERVRYYLSFLGGPGEVKVTFDFTSRGIAEQAIATLFNQDFQKIEGLSMILNPGESVRKVKRIQVSQQQTMIVELDLENGAFFLRLEGAVRFP